ncbi:hypothetical protein N826_30870 [Skermanella aerolata KACC 11604]|nr:hypothetical protein N826_30870 [Skermanella aerolata KACC 11604]
MAMAQHQPVIIGRTGSAVYTLRGAWIYRDTDNSH